MILIRIRNDLAHSWKFPGKLGIQCRPASRDHNLPSPGSHRLADLQRAGLTVTSEEREEIEGLRNRMEANRRAREELRQRERSIRDDYADKKQRYMALKAGTTAS